MKKEKKGLTFWQEFAPLRLAGELTGRTCKKKINKQCIHAIKYLIS